MSFVLLLLQVIMKSSGRYKCGNSESEEIKCWYETMTAYVKLNAHFLNAHFKNHGQIIYFFSL